MLANRPHRALAVESSTQGDGIDLSLQTTGLDRVDAYVDDRPRATTDVTDGTHTLHVALNGGAHHTVDLRGYSAGELAASRKLEFG